MTPTYPKHLTQLGIRSLATGSPHTDTDAFVAWCAAVAAVAHPRSRLVRSDSRQSMRVGIDTLTFGPSVAGVEDHVIATLRELQNQHLRNAEAREASAYDFKREGRPPSYQPVVLKSDATGRVDPMNVTEAVVGTGNLANWMDKVDPSQIQAEFAVRPAFFVEGSNPSQLSEHLKACHLGKTLVAVRVMDTKCVPTSDMVFRAITAGISLGERLPHQVSGRIMATIPAAVLTEFAPTAVVEGGIVGGSLWLTGDKFCDTDWPQRPKEHKCAWDQHFKRVLKELLHHRFHGAPLELPVTAETGEAIAEFSEQLQALEPQMPEISNSLRSLLPTLIFGMSALMGHHRKKDQMLDVGTVSILAQLSAALADRMVEHYLSLVDAERRNRVRRFADTIQERLQEGPHSVRDLTRRVHKLRVGDANAALDYLTSRGLVVESSSLWRLTDSSSTLPAPETQHATNHEN